MITREENERMTRVEGDAPMGRLMREHYWIPFALSSQIEREGDPLQVRLLGENYIAFRAADGRIGFLDELCPHRRASLALGRVEGNGIRCIFHGWKMDVSGKVVEAPTQLVRQQEFCERVQVTHFPVQEVGGLLWVFLGQAQAPKFPELPFAGSREGNRWLSVSAIPCNWMQGVEGALDSAHVGVLHQAWMQGMSKLKHVPQVTSTLDNPPRYETQAMPYGLRAAALRQRAEGRTYVRITQYFMPFVTLPPADRPAPNEGYLFLVAPVDDVNHLLFFGYYSERSRKPPHEIGLAAPGVAANPFEFVRVLGERATRWGQDRELMKQGHFTGFPQAIIQEDVGIQMSMGEIVDRSRENVSSSDVAIVQARRLLLRALDDLDAGMVPPGSALGDVPARIESPLDVVLDAGVRWDSSIERAAA
jgi:phthalate 4,5-dioxygenase oxygenase subunit